MVVKERDSGGRLSVGPSAGVWPFLHLHFYSFRPGVPYLKCLGGEVFGFSDFFQIYGCCQVHKERLWDLNTKFGCLEYTLYTYPERYLYIFSVPTFLVLVFAIQGID